MRITTLNALTAGISRLRNAGGADPSTLYDLENGWVDMAGRVQSRPGTEDGVDLPEGSKGLCSFENAMVVFSNRLLTGLPTGYSVEVLTHPTDPTLELADIWFNAPFLGILYVAAEFENGDVFHYWLRHADAWQANHVYMEGELVEPSTPNGYVYKATRTDTPNIVWAPNVARTVGDVIEPTTPNGYEYECIDTLGSNPRSGTTEPTWPTEDGATVVEDTDLVPPATPTTATPPPDSQLPEDVVDRYGDGLDNGYRGLMTRISDP